ncbi:MAG: adenylate/guanylate cyclase domain-containing protein [Lachnospiraceae bacterium]|nr:adenylate/guanylate cyclase domain-containing protein [Lachnospiraceae bacterium]
MKKNFVLAIEILLIGLLTFVFCYTDIFYSLDSLYKDRLYQQPRSVDPTIKIISIDEKTMEALGPFGTWPRSTYAEILDILGDYPAVVGFDIMLMGTMNEEDDAVFLNALKERDNVVLAAHLVYETKVEMLPNGEFDVDHMHVSQVEVPYTGDAAPIGYANTSPDSDGKIRSYLPVTQVENADGTVTEYTSLSYQIYLEYCESMNMTPISPVTDDNGVQWIYYAGKPYEYESISLIDVLEGKVDARVFTDCIVLVGAYATGLQDQFTVPNSNNQMFGVEINANLIQSFLDEQFPLPANRLGVSVVFALITMAMFMCFSKLHLKWGTVIFVLAEIVTVVSGIVLFTKAGISIPGFYLVLMLALAYVIALAGGYLYEWAKRRKIASVFRKYVAPQVVDDIMKSGRYKVELGGESRDIAVLFVDIRGFTPLSESLKPAEVVEILNEYLNLTTNAIFKNSGTLDKFIGDATMAVFNAPFDLEDYEYRAVCAAWDIVAGAKELEQKCLERFGKSVAFGVGVNCGEAVVGNIGCDFRMDYTAIGDTVNTAARLESNAKRGQVLISEHIYQRVKDRVKVQEIGEILLKGKSQGVCVYELLGVGCDSAEKNEDRHKAIGTAESDETVSAGNSEEENK